LLAALIGSSAMGQSATSAKPKLPASPGQDWNAIERDFIASHPKLAHRDDTKLYLRLHDGTETQIADSPKCAEVEDLLACNNHKSLVTYYKDPGIYLLYVKLLKGARYMMIDDATGGDACPRRRADLGTRPYRLRHDLTGPRRPVRL
jgi:hypothetical protein